MKLNGRTTRQTAALKVGIDPKTARKYLKQQRLPSELKVAHTWRTRPDPFEAVWPTLTTMLSKQPRLEARTLLEWLIVEHKAHDPVPFHMGQLRTLQRRVCDWRALNGPGCAVIFPQDIKPGKQSQSDCTWMNSLNITLNGVDFPHLLFHFMLPYSRWEHVSICFSESFDSLTLGYTKAVWSLGATAVEHRTDNLSAATHAMGSSRVFNESWLEFLSHHRVTPSRNNPGVSHENGSVEKSHDLFKKAVDQQLLLRGSRDFDSQLSYESFLLKIQEGRNSVRQLRLNEEWPLLTRLPERQWYAPKSLSVCVTSASTISVYKGIYSVPSRLIGHTLTADVFPKEIILRYSKTVVQSMPRLANDHGAAINYRHIIAHLLRKPGAFRDYQYRDCLFPQLIFRQAYDALIAASPVGGSKQYLQVLHLAAIGSESEVAMSLSLLLEANVTPTLERVKALLDAPRITLPTVTIEQPCLAHYDCLIPNYQGASHVHA